ncbi:hypothetical protein SLE2022_275100 [Rubroshorea leprosula]
MADPSVTDLTTALGERLSLTADEEVTLNLDDGSGVDPAGGGWRGCLVGTVLINKRYNMEAMENTLAGAWRPVKGIHMRVLGQNLFAFYFFHPVDMQRVLAVGPWRFANHVMVLKEATEGRRLAREELYEVPFWIQIHGLPPDRMTAITGRQVGEALGRLVEVDDGGGNAWGVQYIRVRVFIDSRKPLRRGMKLTLREGPIWVDFQYERLPNFCFCCGMLDHIERDCELGLEMEKMGIAERPYNEKLRAIPKHLQQTSEARGARWLRDSSGNRVATEARWRRPIPRLGSSSNMEIGGLKVDSNQRDWGCDGLVSSQNQDEIVPFCGIEQQKVSVAQQPILQVQDSRSGKGGAKDSVSTSVGVPVEVGPLQPQSSNISNPGSSNVEGGPVFFFQSSPCTASPKTRAWKKEARERKSVPSHFKSAV